MSEKIELINEDDLDEVSGGNIGSSIIGECVLKVKSASGAVIRSKVRKNSKILGTYPMGQILNGATDVGDSNGTSWFRVPGQSGMPTGYIEKNCCKVVSSR